ncbi:hypothetical protein [Streptomyces sp. NPDC002619]|uniref:hypothetical protein n=1 Tax=Streptomyces sp. NPDC002619 TaxID=3364655 RepID=UPI00368DB411
MTEGRRVGALAVLVGAALLAGVGCTAAGTGTTHTHHGPAATRRAGTRSTPLPTGPARPIGTARLSPNKDRKLAAWLTKRFESPDDLPGNAPVPSMDTIVVVSRPTGRDHPAQVSWMTDARHFCFAVLYEAASTFTCGEVPDGGRGPGVDAGPESQGLFASDRGFFQAILVGESGDFRFFPERGPAYTPLHQASAAFADGTEVTLLAYGTTSAVSKIDPEICTAAHSNCFRPYR